VLLLFLSLPLPLVYWFSSGSRDSANCPDPGAFPVPSGDGLVSSSAGVSPGEAPGEKGVELTEQVQAPAVRDFAAELNRALALPDGPGKKSALDRVFLEWGRQDGRTALAFAVKEYEQSGNLSVLRSALQGMAEKSPGEALETLKAMNLSDRIKIDFGADLLEKWTDADPATAAGWAKENRYPQWWGGPVAKVADEWSRTDPRAAVEWSAQLSPGLDQISALVASTSRWSKTDLKEVADFVGRQAPGFPRDIMAGTLAREFGQEDPSSGLKWASLVQDATGRERAAAGAVADVYGKDPAQAATLLQKSGLPVAEQQGVMRRLQGGPWWR